MWNPQEVRELTPQLALDPKRLRDRDDVAFEKLALAGKGAEACLASEAMHYGPVHGAERIYGTPAVRDVSWEPWVCRGTRTRSVVALEDARIVGWRAAFTREGRLVLDGRNPTDHELTTLAERPASAHEGFLFDPRDGHIYFRRPTGKRLLGGRTLFLATLEPGNFGSFLLRQLPLLLWLKQLGLSFDQMVVGSRTTWCNEGLALLDMVGQAPVYSVSEVFGQCARELLVLADDGVVGLVDLATQKRLADLVARLRPDDAGRRLYVSRRLQAELRPGYRPLQNEYEVEQLVRRHGYEIVRPETQTLAEQIRTFATSSATVGPSGSGMLNVMFAPRNGAVVDLEGYSSNERQHASLYASTGKRYSFVFGELSSDEPSPMSRRPWRVELSDVARALSEIQ